MPKWCVPVLMPFIFLMPSISVCIEPESEYHILKTEEAYTVGYGDLQAEIEAGIVKQSDESELYEIPILRITYGISDWADLELDDEYLVVRGTDVMYPDREIRNISDEGIGDLRVRLKMSPFKFGHHVLGIQGITKIPNSDRGSGVGTDEADFTWKVLLSSDWGRLVTHLNAGMAVLGDPLKDRDQRDYLIWGVAGEYSLTDSLTLMAEVTGSTWAENNENGFTENISEGTEGNGRAQVALALTGPLTADWRWGIYGFKGLNNQTDDWGVRAGVSRLWDIGAPTVSPAAPSERGPSPETYYNPMKTVSAYTIGERNIHLETAFDYIRQADNSTLSVLPDVIVGWGIGPWADFRLEFQYLRVEDAKLFAKDGSVFDDDINSSGRGDVRTELKIAIYEFKYGLLGAQCVTKLPSARDEDALGTDETDVYLKGLFSTEWSNFFPSSPLSRLKTHINAGIAVQGNPYNVSSQNDVFIWGILAEYSLSESFTFWGELDGSEDNLIVKNVAEGVYGEDLVEARLGLTGPLPDFSFTQGWKWGVTGSVGLTNNSPDWSASIGLSRTWGL